MTISFTTASAAVRRNLRRAISRLHDFDDTPVCLATIETIHGKGVSLHFSPRAISAEDLGAQSHMIHRAVMLACGTTGIEMIYDRA